MSRYDVVVLGVGAVGSAVLSHVAQGGKSVLGIDRYHPPHKFGSTHGETRISRAAIGEGLEYTPLVKRSHELWRQLEALTGKRLFVQCGCLTIPNQQSGKMRDVDSQQFFSNIEAATSRFHIDAGPISPAVLQEKYPAFRTAPTDRAFLDREGGYLLVEECVRSQIAVAERFGAHLCFGKRANSFTRDGKIQVTLEDGSTVEAGKLIVTTGPWIEEMIRPLKGRVHVTRQLLYWFEIKSHPERFGSGAPVFIWDVNGRERAQSDIYGFPYVGGPENGVKIANEVPEEADPDTVSREVTAEEKARMYELYVAPFLPDLGPKCLRSEVCLYTNAPGARFVIDRDPANDCIIYASACSGHGFKHSAAVGEAIADMALGREPRFSDVSGFGLSKLPQLERVANLVQG